MATTTKPRPVRLRQSCDGCFLAKVKCSKARPICSRCLACGIECRYSPSSRAGKPKSDKSNLNGHETKPPNAEMLELSPLQDEKAMFFAAQQAGAYKVEAGWSASTSADGEMSRSGSMAEGLSLLGMSDSPFSPEQQVAATAAAVQAAVYATAVPWTPPTDSAVVQYADPPIFQGHMPAPHARSHSFDMAMPTAMPTTWVDSTTDMVPYGPTQAPTPASMNYFPSPSTTPNIRPSPAKSKSMSGASGASGSGGTCTCFTLCLQSLQALHNASSPSCPPLDEVLNLNSKAVEGCATMLTCSRCMNRSGTHTAVMLLATVMGKITSFYQNASRSYFDDGSAHGGMGNGPSSAVMGGSTATSSGLGVSFGAYQINGNDGRRFELEILAMELRKLEELYARFREVCAELSEDPEVGRAMIDYLGNTLSTTMKVVNMRKGDMGYA